MKDISPEMEKMQLELMAKLTPHQRIAFGCEMFMAAREHIFSSIPKGLPESEQKKIYFEKMYGEPLPQDFFEEE